MNDLDEKEIKKQMRSLKKCGHEYGYRCSCRIKCDLNITDKVFDLVDELKLRKRT